MSYFTMYLFMATALTTILAFLGRILPTLSSDLKKMAPYECGFDPMKSARLPFSFRFFLVAILFLIFDLEMALLMVLPFITPFFKSNLSILPLLTFMIILMLGLWYEWSKGGLEWAEE